VKITIVFSGAGMEVAFERTQAKCLPSLPTALASRPLIGLDLLDITGGTVYRRHFTPPGKVEIPGIRPTWVQLAKDHKQVLVALVPRLPLAKGIKFYAGEDVWLDKSFPGPL